MQRRCAGHAEAHTRALRGRVHAVAFGAWPACNFADDIAMPLIFRHPADRSPCR